MNKNKKLIPRGYYCYIYKRGKRLICPYHCFVSALPEQFNGYCIFLEKSDLNLSIYRNKHANWRNRKGEKIKVKDFLPLSLLWDMCKECGINE